MLSDEDDIQNKFHASHSIIIEPYFSINRQKICHSIPFAQAAKRTSFCNIVHQKCEPSRFAKNSCDKISMSFTIFMQQKSLEVICKGTMLTVKLFAKINKRKLITLN